MFGPIRSRFRRSSGVVLGLGVALCGVLALADANPAVAQGFGWFGGMFGGGESQRGPSYPGYGYGNEPQSYYAPRRRAPRRKALPLDDAQDTLAKPNPTKAATVFVDVFGDSLGQLLANGLDDALADKADVGIIHMGRGSSGLVNDAYFDWPKAIDDLLARRGSQNDTHETQGSKDNQKPAKQDKINVAIMMIGSNDRQPIVQGGQKLQPGSDEWNAVYRKRVLAIAEAFQKKKIPLIWVGIPIVKNDDVADDMAALNDIYRDVASRAGATYIDTWEAFTDDNGEFAAYGPDINGQTVRLRSADGIYFTKAGARKLAHFVEGQVRRDLDGMTPAPQLPTVDTPTVDAKSGKPTVALVKPEAGPIKKLADLPAAKDGHLTDLSQVKKEEGHDAIVANILVKGQTEPAPVGRADNFRWPPDGGTNGAR